MKKIIFFAVMIIMLLCTSLTAFASPSSTGIDVKAKFVYVTDDTTYIASTNAGEATITTSNGFVITVTENLPDELILVIKQVMPSDEDAYNWFCKVLDGKMTDIFPFDIFFLKNGERIELSAAMNITITMPNIYSSPQMYSVESAGNATRLDSTVSGEKISFQTDHNSFYVLGNKIVGGSSNPQTSENKLIFIYSILLLVSCGFANALFIKRKISNWRRIS